RNLTAAASALLSQQPWRGNVRELRNFIYRLALLAREEVIDTSAIEPLLNAGDAASVVRPSDDTGHDAHDLASAIGMWLDEHTPPSGEVYDAVLAAVERPLFLRVLSQTAGNQLRAAQVLGINRNTLRKRLQDLRITPDEITSV
ncbi:MAG: helix-turn-helix domain-containing protein, partial [Novosphingobium sp.]